MARSQMRFPNLGRGALCQTSQGTSQDSSLSATSIQVLNGEIQQNKDDFEEKKIQNTK